MKRILIGILVGALVGCVLGYFLDIIYYEGAEFFPNFYKYFWSFAGGLTGLVIGLHLNNKQKRK